MDSLNYALILLHITSFSAKHAKANVFPVFMKTGTIIGEELKLQRQDGSALDVSLNVSAARDKKGGIIFSRSVLRDITEQKHSELQILKAHSEIKQLKDRIESESVYLQEEIKLEHNFDNIIGQSESLSYVLYRVEQVARTDSPVFIYGETGTGKELIARATHQLIQYAFTRLVANHMLQNYDGVLKVGGEVGNKKVYDPRSYLKSAEASMAERVKKVPKDLKSVGKTLARHKHRVLLSSKKTILEGRGEYLRSLM